MQCRDICLCLQAPTPHRHLPLTERASQEICERPGPSFQVRPVARGIGRQDVLPSATAPFTARATNLAARDSGSRAEHRSMEQTSLCRAVIPRLVIGRDGGSPHPDPSYRRYYQCSATCPGVTRVMLRRGWMGSDVHLPSSNDDTLAVQSMLRASPIEWAVHPRTNHMLARGLAARFSRYDCPQATV